MKKVIASGLIFILAIISTNIAIAKPKNLSQQAPQIQVFVSVLPLKYFVNRIGDNKVSVRTMVKPGASPETYSPTPKQMAALSNSKIFFRIGVPFEHAWIGKIAKLNPQLKIVDLRDNIKLQKFPEASSLDPHIWNDPILVMQMAKTIKNNLITIDTANRQFYQKNYTAFIKDLSTLNTNIKKILHNVPQKQFLVYHPAWGYFANRYGLKQIAIEQEGKEPNPRSINKILSLAKQHKLRAIFIEPQFSKAQATIIAKTIDAKVIKLNPLAENYLQNMLHVAKTLATYSK